MKFSFRLNKHALENVANEALKSKAIDLQKALDDVYAVHKGKPVEEVERALSGALKRSDFTPDAIQLRTWAQAIEEGRRIVVQTKDVRL